MLVVLRPNVDILGKVKVGRMDSNYCRDDRLWESTIATVLGRLLLLDDGRGGVVREFLLLRHQRNTR